MGFLDTVEKDLGKVAHAFVVGASKLKAAIIGAAGLVDKAEPEIKVIEDLANSVVAQIYPEASIVALAIEAALNKVFTAVDAAAAAAAVDGLNVSLDIATVNAIKAALPQIKAQAATVPGS